MHHIADAPVRGYRSQLRAEQAQATRARILDAAVRVMASGIASISVPAVAHEAGVSIPTVYRHFRTKADLLGEIYPHLAQRAGLDRLQPPRSVEELREGVRAYFERLDALGPEARAAMASPAAEEVRQVSMAQRVSYWRRLADSIEPRLVDADRDRIARLLAVLITSSSLRVWRDHVGVSVQQAADDVDWVIRTAIAASRTTEE